MHFLKQLFFQIAFAVLYSATALGQISNYTTSELEQKPILSQDGIEIRLIDARGMQTLIHKSKKPLKLFTIITRNCGGTPDALSYEAYLDGKYAENVDHWIIFSDNLRDSTKVFRKLKQFKLRGTYYLVSDIYNEDPEDDRQKGTDLRNAICLECKQDIIGVPYTLLYDKENKIIMHGYPSMKGPLENIPSDFIGYFIKNLPTQ